MAKEYTEVKLAVYPNGKVTVLNPSTEPIEMKPGDPPFFPPNGKIVATNTIGVIRSNPTYICIGGTIYCI